MDTQSTLIACGLLLAIAALYSAFRIGQHTSATRDAEEAKNDCCGGGCCGRYHDEY